MFVFKDGSFIGGYKVLVRCSIVCLEFGVFGRLKWED